jgi:hypothetical protein
LQIIYLSLFIFPAYSYLSTFAGLVRAALGLTIPRQDYLLEVRKVNITCFSGLKSFLEKF